MTGIHEIIIDIEGEKPFVIHTADNIAQSRRLKEDEPATLIDAGYFTITKHKFPVGKPPVTFSIDHPDLAVLFKLKPGQFLPDDWEGKFIKEGNERYFLMRPELGTIFYLDKDLLSAVEEINAIFCNPKPTQLATLDHALRMSTLLKFEKPIGNVAILVQDVGIKPAGLSNHLDMLLPSQYKELLDAYAFYKPLLISERRCRNHASKLVDKKIHTLSDKGISPEKMYENTGFIVAELDKNAAAGAPTCSNGELALTSAGLLTQEIKAPGREAYPLIGLNRAAGEPSCGVFNAGRLHFFKEAGYNDVFSVYNYDDDPGIARKLCDGMVIGAFLNPAEQMTNILLCIRGENGFTAGISGFSKGFRWDFEQARDKCEMGMGEVVEEINEVLGKAGSVGSKASITPVRNGRGMSISQRGVGGKDNCELPDRIRD